MNQLVLKIRVLHSSDHTLPKLLFESDASDSKRLKYNRRRFQRFDLDCFAAFFSILPNPD